MALIEAIFYGLDLFFLLIEEINDTIFVVVQL